MLSGHSRGQSLIFKYLIPSRSKLARVLRRHRQVSVRWPLSAGGSSFYDPLLDFKNLINDGSTGQDYQCQVDGAEDTEQNKWKSAVIVENRVRYLNFPLKNASFFPLKA
jgi:hypothetical protein